MNQTATQPNTKPESKELKLTGTKDVPADAMQFDAQLQFAETQGEGTQTAPIMMLGRSAQPIYHWYWGKIIHDMAGFKADHKRIPIDWAHDAYKEEGIGYLDKFKADNDGLHVEGELVSVNAEDKAATIMKKSAAGIPYQASIFFRPEVVEEVQAGASAKVNGYTVEGPATIVRKWALRGMAVCLYGADHRTQSQFSDDGDRKVAVSYFTAETDMSTGNDTTNPAPTTLTQGQPGQPAGESTGTPANGTQLTPADAPDGQQTQVPATLTDAQQVDGKVDNQLTEGGSDRSELKRYIEKFGAENGANWFADGVSFSDAMSKHVDALNAQAAENEKKFTELQTKLKSIDRGEDTPVNFSSNDDADQQNNVPAQFAQLGDNVGRFAAGIKLPK